MVTRPRPDSDGVLDSDGVKRLYDRIAARYNLTTFPFRLLRGRRLAEHAIDELHLRRGDTVVDLGTGTGWNLSRLADRVGATGTVIGIDISPRMLDQARQNIRDRANIELVEADIATYQPPCNTAAVISTFAIEMRPDYDSIIERLATTIRPGGRIAVTGLRHADHWPGWLADAGARTMQFFGVNDSYRQHRPWEAVEQHTIDTTYADSHAGVIYLAAGTTAVP
jgi:demethylmenaquinone methyltransferase/2-methoxy-6-polyprenyl-1,4-benzoquinol methylase